MASADPDDLEGAWTPHTPHGRLVEDAVRAAKLIFEDYTALPREVLGSLLELRREVDQLIETVESGLAGEVGG